MSFTFFTLSTLCLYSVCMIWLVWNLMKKSEGKTIKKLHKWNSSSEHHSNCKTTTVSTSQINEEPQWMLKARPAVAARSKRTHAAAHLGGDQRTAIIGQSNGIDSSHLPPATAIHRVLAEDRAWTIGNLNIDSFTIIGHLWKCYGW